MTPPPLRSLVCCTVAAAMISFSVPVSASAPAGDSTVLGLESEDAEAAERLTAALRKAFAKRGIGGGQELPLVELKLTMGCETDAPDCLSEGGKTLGVDVMVYGHLRPAAGGGYSMDLKQLNVGTGQVEQEVTVELGAADMTDDAIDQTAANAVARMLGEDPGPDPVLGDDSDDEPTDAGPRDKGKLVWGKQSPTPRWKSAGLWTSVALMAASLGAAVGTTLMIRPNGPVYNELIDEAEASLEDDKDSNDVDPDMDDDLCEFARKHPVGDPDPATVTNSAVTKVCNKADALATTATVTWITTGVFAASTVLFTILTFVHRDEPGMAKLRRRGLTLGAAPTRGGVVLGGGVRF